MKAQLAKTNTRHTRTVRSYDFVAAKSVAKLCIREDYASGHAVLLGMRMVHFLQFSGLIANRNGFDV